jgi:magnesium-transporting ATPase (P-type)
VCRTYFKLFHLKFTDQLLKASVKGAPETIKAFLTPGTIPHWYDETYKWYTRRGSRVLALAWKDLGSLGVDKVGFLLQNSQYGALY